MDVFDRTTADCSLASCSPIEAAYPPKCAATTIALSEREMELLRPAHLESIIDEEAGLAETLISLGATVLITDVFPSGEITTKWRDKVKGPLIIAVLRSFDAVTVLNTQSCSHNNLICCHFDRRSVSLQQALSGVEHSHIYGMPVLPAPAVRSGEYPASKSVAVIGAGIVSLISALEFAKAGYAVDVFEKSPDPRSRPNWTRLGCTHGGEGVRMFSLTECDNYHERSSTGETKLNQFIDTALDQMGWSLGEEQRFGAEDLVWKSKFRDVPIFLADHYNEDIFALNHESYRLWRDAIEADPALFEDVVLNNGLLRICRTEAYHHKQLQRQKHVRSFIRELDRANLIEAYPALETGCANGEIYGGIEVEGFTLDIHRFVQNVLNAAERLGITFHWNTAVEGILRNGDAVSGVKVEGAVHRADHYFVSPGAYADRLLDATETRGSVHGVLGAWISFPNTEPKLQRSMKVSREGYVANCGNIILNKDDDGSDRLIFGSGFGYLGAEVSNICHARLDRLFDSMQDYIGQLFPEALKAALDDGSLMARRKYCIRPWTPTCLGVFEVQAAETGSFIIATGHNTGGFSQSTSIAKAALAAMRGDSHPMHHLYNPKRFRAFW